MDYIVDICIKYEQESGGQEKNTFSYYTESAFGTAYRKTVMADYFYQRKKLKKYFFIGISVQR